MERSTRHTTLTEEKPTDLPHNARCIGRDAEGATHHVVPGERVYVVADGELEQEQALDGRPLSHWVDYVTQERGWDDLRYDGWSFGAWLADAVAQCEEAH